MSAFETFTTEDLNGLDRSAERESVVIHYSSIPARLYRGRPISDWVALFSYGTAVTTAGYFLIIAMAMFPRT